ncbi:uncharacterized protein Dana_GF22270 [Drosophila ananassae]|uniref:Protein swallow n=1 Tax=Drosophila ananassae TaxID=7217 RepID=B3MZ57_DROAN|nr:protein swallow [Drosophila ananassae]EDV32901.2 uncharacterized protein Dana_GF22270 [Drosophila ananassae]
MSLQDESFPADDLFDQLNSLGASSSRDFKRQFAEHHQPEAFERNPTPFLGSDCSAENSYTDAANKSAKTCVSDPTGRDPDEEEDADEDGQDGSADQLECSSSKSKGNGRSNKAVSYQDIHSAYTKRRYQHVTSKVGKYIADIQAQDQARRNSGASMLRHSSMPEYLTPRSRQRHGGGHYSVDQLHQKDESLADSSEGGNASNNQSYDRLQSELEALQLERDRQTSYNNYLQEKLDKKVMESMQLKMNFEVLRTELTDCKQKLTRYQAHSLRSLNWPPVGIPKATQTDRQLAPVAAIASSSSSLNPAQNVMENYVTPHPNGNANLTYNSSDGSIEIALLSVAPTARPAHPDLRKVQPMSLDFSNESADGGEANNANGEARGNSNNSSSRPRTRRGHGPGPNNSESSHPSSNDSAIEVEGHESRSPFQPQGREWRHRRQEEAVYYFDKRNNRVIEVMAINLGQGHNQSHNLSQVSVSDSRAQLLNNSQFLSQSQVRIRTKRRTLGSRVMRFFGPCVRCRYAEDGNPGINGTYTVGLPLMEEEFIDLRNQR